MDSSSSSPRMKKLRKKLPISHYDISSSASKTQSIAIAIIVFTFTLYFIGLFSSIITLPSVNIDSHTVKEDKKISINLFKSGLADVYKQSDSAATSKLRNRAEKTSEGKVGVDDGEDPKPEGGIEDDGDDGVVEPKSDGQDDDTQNSKKKIRQETGTIKQDASKAEAAVSTLPKTSTVPKSIWPVTIRNEDGQWEDITHPGDLRTVMTVPKFWSLPVHDQKLMSREKAMQIGTCVTPDSKGSHQRGDECPEKDRTIYVAIASYRDWQCRYTLESIFSRAKYPNRVRIGVVDQIADGDDRCDSPIKDCAEDPSQAICTLMDQVDVFQMDAPLSIGPVFARHIGHRLYRGEYYAMQSDAHVSFTQDWDVDIIKQQESTGDDMAVLTTYLTDIENSIDENGNSRRRTRPIMCNTDYEGGAQGQHLRHLSQPEGMPTIKGQPQLEPYWAAGYSFSRGHFVVNVPYDLYQPMIFQGEEMSIGIRGFTIGYDFFAPERSVCFHHYANGKNAVKRNKVKHFWENSSKYQGTGVKAMARLLGIVHMNPEKEKSSWSHVEEDLYGIGNVRTPEQFYQIFGIDVREKTANRNLCNFVQPGIMHRQFMKHLRSDGMGIDYKKINKSFQSYLGS